jgi:siroheme synthase
VGNETGKTIILSPGEFAELPRSTIRAKVPHTEETAEYEGILLAEILLEAGVRTTDPSRQAKKLPGILRHAYVLVEAADGYQVVFSIPEVFPESPGREILLADRKNGKALDAKAGPYQVIVAGSSMFERWVRQVTRILVQPASASPFPSPATTAAKPIAAKNQRGGVYLVGAGPGAPDLITVRATEVLRNADLVFCFSWMKDELASFVRPDLVEVASPALRGGQYCGRKPDEFTGELRDRVIHTNEELEKLKTRIGSLIEEGKTVVFADNGDPMIFSPWSWVPEHLAEFKPVVVPGLSSFNAANAALGRSVASLGSVTISSGIDMGSPDENGRLAGTVVFFTHRRKLPEILPKLQVRYPADTPVGVVCDVSYPPEKVHMGTLGTILGVLGDEKLPHLYLLYVGDGIKQGTCCR